MTKEQREFQQRVLREFPGAMSEAGPIMLGLALAAFKTTEGAAFAISYLRNVADYLEGLERLPETAPARPSLTVLAGGRDDANGR